MILNKIEKKEKKLNNTGHVEKEINKMRNEIEKKIKIVWSQKE